MQALRNVSVTLKERAVRALHPEKDPRTLRLNQNTSLLKIIACIVMMVDHMGKMIFPDAYYFRMTGEWAFLFPAGNILRIIGRLAMPMFAYGIAVGSAYSRNVWKYVFRLFLMGILVQPLYMEAMGHVGIGSFDWKSSFYRIDLIIDHYYSGTLNIFFTLGFGAALLACFRSKTYVLMVICALLAWRYNVLYDYGIKAVLLIVLFYAFLDKPLASFLAVFLYMVNWGMPSLFTYGRLSSTVQLYAVWALPLIYLPMKSRLKIPKWLFYAYYPAHLILIYLLIL